MRGVASNVCGVRQEIGDKVGGRCGGSENGDRQGQMEVMWTCRKIKKRRGEEVAEILAYDCKSHSVVRVVVQTITRLALPPHQVGVAT